MPLAPILMKMIFVIHPWGVRSKYQIPITRSFDSLLAHNSL
jgi:hypothetical protein